MLTGKSPSTALWWWLTRELRWLPVLLKQGRLRLRFQIYLIMILHSILFFVMLIFLSESRTSSSTLKLIRNPIPTDADIFLSPLSTWPTSSLPSSARILVTTRYGDSLQAEVMSIQEVIEHSVWENIYSDGWTLDAKSARNSVIRCLYNYLRGGGDFHQLYYMDRTGDPSAHYFFRGSLYYLLFGYHDEDTMSICKCNTRVQYMMYRNLRCRITNRGVDAEMCFFICGQILRQNGQKLIRLYGNILQNTSPLSSSLYPFREDYGTSSLSQPSLNRELDSLLKCFSEFR